EQGKIARQQVETAQAQYKLVQRQVALGLKAGTDLLEAEALLLTDQLGVTQSKNQLMAARLALRQEMNLVDTMELEIDTTAVNRQLDYWTMKPDVDSIYRNALTFVPEILAGEARLHAAEKEMDISRGNLYPSLGISGGYGTGF